MKALTRSFWPWVAIAAITGLAPSASFSQDIKGNVRLYRELDDVELKGTWFYDDLASARKEALATDRPLLVVLRCPP